MTKDGRIIRATSVALALGPAGAALGGVLLLGPSGAGKSDLALRLIDSCPFRAARLIADDYTALTRHDDGWRAAAPPTLAGALELRGIGVVAMEHRDDIPVLCAFDLAAAPARAPACRDFTPEGGGPALPLFACAPFAASAPAKLRAAANALRYGLFREFRQD